jgi:RimJ/RimL family protein N-acetyltransferase
LQLNSYKIPALDLQPILHNSVVSIRPLKEEDFDVLYALASDPLVWEQHPNRNRYKKEVFQNYFEGAMQSKGAFFVTSSQTGEAVGCSRYYGFDPGRKEVTIGYTFVGRKFWSKGFNPALKQLMIDHAFNHADKVLFHIGACNVRSQKAIQRLGAVKAGEVEMAYHGEDNALNFIYEISKQSWQKRSL